MSRVRDADAGGGWPRRPGCAARDPRQGRRFAPPGGGAAERLAVRGLQPRPTVRPTTEVEQEAVAERAQGATLVYTVKDRCRLCYTCVRECPAKAIRICGGQATVVEERCVGCAHCVRVCSQEAKQYRRDTDAVRALLASGRRVAACLAPVFPVEFPELSEGELVRRVRALGFTVVVDGGFGTDLVAERYRRLPPRQGIQGWIASTCPAITGYVARFHPELVPALVPIASPMVALARSLRRRHGQDLAVVYVGPCVAKKVEARDPSLAGEVAEVITFAELRELLGPLPQASEDALPTTFDPPTAKGAPFLLQLGMAGPTRPAPPRPGAVVSADGRLRAYEAVEEFAEGTVQASLLHLLSCRGCLSGPGMTSRARHFARHAALVHHAHARMAAFDPASWAASLAADAALDLDRTFDPDDRRIAPPDDQALEALLQRMGKARPQDELNCGACGYDDCRALARAVHAGLAEPDMCLPWTVEHLRTALTELEASHRALASAQAALHHAEKLANLGQLAAGVAHEVNNPLGVILMYAHLLLDDCPSDVAGRSDLALIAEHAERCRRIVSELLDFARQNKVVVQPVDLPELVARAVRTLPAAPGVEVRLEHRGDPVAELDRDQLAQVLTNLVVNACDAMPDGGVLTVRTSGDEARVHLEVEDTGTGISPEHLGRIFEPFFTTKPMGRGTGLGLAVCYGIVKVHHGDIQVTSRADPAAGPTGSTFKVTLPRRPEVA